MCTLQLAACARQGDLNLPSEMMCSNQLLTNRARVSTGGAGNPSASLPGPRRRDSCQTLSRRAALAGLPLLGLLRGDEAKSVSPYEEASRISYGPTSAGGIRRCPGNVNPNCLSTASNTQAYSPAWQAPEQEPERVVQVVEEAVKTIDPQAYLIDSQILPDGSQYRRFSVAGLWGQDVLEFVVMPDITKGSRAGALVVQRSMAGSVKYVWPIQQPVSDLDTQKKRLTRIREELGYRLVGCDLIECYE